MSEMKTGSRHVTIKDVAKAAGVGIVTVSRALNDQEGVSDSTRARIQKTAAELGYVPNRHARFLKLTANRTIAVLVKGMDNQLFSRILARLEKNIREREYLMNVVSVPHWADELSEAAKIVDEDSMAGIIFLGAKILHRTSDLSRLQVPFVSSTVSLKDSKHRERYSSVAIDDYKESRHVIEYLYSLGHRNIAFVGSDLQDNSVGLLRFKGYQDALSDLGISPRPGWIRSFSAQDDAPYSYENGYLMTRQLLEECGEITAIFAIADVLAIGAIHAVHEAGRSVPEQISVVGFDGLPVGRYLHPPLTTVVQPVEEIAQTTCELLFEQIDDGEPRHVIFPGELRRGGTACATPASAV